MLLFAIEEPHSGSDTPMSVVTAEITIGTAPGGHACPSE